MLKKAKTKAKHIIKLYKFRPLANEEDCERLKGILETGKFWCSTYPELNDPMEGVYNFLPDPNDITNNISELIDLIYKEKQGYKICSFSNEDAFSKPIMWGYYANGFKGVAVEIEICRKEVEEIEYKRDILKFSGKNPDKEAKRILTTKLTIWKHEGEYRFLKKIEEDKEIKIGKITALYYGNPHEGTINRQDIIDNSKTFRKYLELKEKILKELPNIKSYPVKIEKCKVIKDSS
jgi:hypothetical protein